MITDIYLDPTGDGALVIRDDDSVWDLHTHSTGMLVCLRLAVTAYGTVVHRSDICPGDRWVTLDDLTVPTPPEQMAGAA